MNLVFHTEVDQTPQEVIEGFNKELFIQLAPPFPKVNLLRFDGSKTGDIVQLELNFGFFKQRWTSVIIDDFESSDEYYFIDKGTELPFPLKFWVHKHIIKKHLNGAVIIDQVEFKGPNKVVDVLLYPALALQFLYRKPIYKKVFGKN